MLASLSTFVLVVVSRVARTEHLDPAPYVNESLHTEDF